MAYAPDDSGMTWQDKEKGKDRNRGGGNGGGLKFAGFAPGQLSGLAEDLSVGFGGDKKDWKGHLRETTSGSRFPKINYGGGGGGRGNGKGGDKNGSDNESSNPGRPDYMPPNRMVAPAGAMMAPPGIVPNAAQQFRPGLLGAPVQQVQPQMNPQQSAGFQPQQLPPEVIAALRARAMRS